MRLRLAILLGLALPAQAAPPTLAQLRTEADEVLRLPNVSARTPGA